MGKILDAAKEFFTDDNWQFEANHDRPILRLPFRGKNGDWWCYAQERNNQVLFYAVAPVKAAEDHRHAVSEFITRANYGMAIGNFELDFSDGEIRYKTSLDVDEGPLTAALMKPLVYINCLMLDKYLPGLIEVAGGADPKAAVEKIENPEPELQT